MEAKKQEANNKFVEGRSVDVEQNEVVEGESQKQHPPENVAPNVDRLIGPPEYAAKHTNTHAFRTIAQAKRRATNLEVEALAIKNKETQNPGAPAASAC